MKYNVASLKQLPRCCMCTYIGLWSNAEVYEHIMRNCVSHVSSVFIWSNLFKKDESSTKHGMGTCGLEHIQSMKFHQKYCHHNPW